MRYEFVCEKMQELNKWKNHLLKIYENLNELNRKYNDDYCEIYYTKLPNTWFLSYPEHHTNFWDGYVNFCKGVEEIENKFCSY